MSTPTKDLTVAVLGIGIMGAAMTRSLLRERFNVQVWNRTLAKAEPLANAGAGVCSTAQQAVSEADIVITMVFDETAVSDAINAVSGVVPKDAVWLQCSTIGVAGTTRVATLANGFGLKLLDSPVLGTRGPAEQGNLVVLASGDPTLRAQAQPVFDAIGSKTVWVGDHIGQASSLKLACNSWVGTINAATGQALSLARELGIPPKLFLEAIEGTTTDSPYAQLKGKLMLAEDYTPSFAVDGVRKDLSLIAAAAEDAGLDTALIAAVEKAYATASRAGHGGDDMAAVYTAF